MPIAKGPWKIFCAGTQWGIGYKGQNARAGDSDVCSGSQFADTWKDDAAALAAVPEVVAALELIASAKTNVPIGVAKKALAVI